MGANGRKGVGALSAKGAQHSDARPEKIGYAEKRIYVSGRSDRA